MDYFTNLSHFTCRITFFFSLSLTRKVVTLLSTWMTTSTSKPTTACLPHGAVPSTTLFSLYISAMPSLLHTHLALYADETALLPPSWYYLMPTKSRCNDLTQILLFFPWRCGPTRAMASSFLRFLDHTQRRITVGRTPLNEWSAHRGDLCLTTHNTHNRQASMPPMGFEPTISACERPQTYALDCVATGTGTQIPHYMEIPI